MASDTAGEEAERKVQAAVDALDERYLRLAYRDLVTQVVGEVEDLSGAHADRVAAVVGGKSYKYLTRLSLLGGALAGYSSLGLLQDLAVRSKEQKRLKKEEMSAGKSEKKKKRKKRHGRGRGRARSSSGSSGD